MKAFKSPVHYSSNSLACFPLLKSVGIYKIMEILNIHQSSCLVRMILICICIDKLWSNTNMTSFAGFEKGSESILIWKSEKHEIQSWILISIYNIYLILKVDIGFSFQEHLYHVAVVCLCSSTKRGACSLCKSQSTIHQHNYKTEAKLDLYINLQCYSHGQIQTHLIINSILLIIILKTNQLVMMYIPQEAHLDKLHYSEEFQLTV